MITLELGNSEYYDEASNQFLFTDSKIVRFEYSLRMLYDWEAKWMKPFMKKEGITEEEYFDFYKRMALDPIEDTDLTIEVIKLLKEYIEKTPTATTFSSIEDETSSKKLPTKPKTYTAEELYALMFSSRVDISFENRNLNRLMIVLRIIGSYNSPPKKMNKQDIMKQNAKLNAQRKAQMKTKG